MLKWTKLYRNENKVSKNDSSKTDKTSDSYKDPFTAVRVTDSLESRDQPTEPEKKSITISGSANTGQNYSGSKEIYRSEPHSEHLSESDKLTSTRELDSLKSLLPQVNLLQPSSSESATERPEPKTATITTSQSQFVATLEGGTMSLTSSFSPETSSTLTSHSSNSTQSKPSTETTASDTAPAENYQNETFTSPPLTPPSQRKYPQAMASTLPDIARSVPTTEREVLGPEVEWEQEDLNLDQLANMDNFPCVCFFEEHFPEKHGQREFLSAGLKIYSRQPVLFHVRTRKKQARARTIFKDPRGAYYEVGQTMIIPDDYQGWFEVVPSDFSRAACFMSIDEVAKAMPRKFFTRSNIKGIRIEGEGEQQKYLERKIAAGSVLGTKGTFTAKWKTRAETGLFKKKTTEWELQEVTYLKCVDRDKQEILIPITHKGKFNAIYEQGQLTQNAVYSMKDILSDLALPIKVRLLFGKAPVVPCIFTGMLVIRSAAIDDAIVGSTILNTRNVLFEIPVKAPVKVKYISHDEPFVEMASYKDAQKLCKKYAKLFSTMIKLSPDLDTDQKVIMHVPSDPSVMRQVDEALRALDLITDISFTGEPKDLLLDSSDSGSMNSDDQMVMPKGGTLEDLEEFKGRESHTHV